MTVKQLNGNTMKVYCVFEDYTSSYPEDCGETLVKIFDSKEKAESFIKEQEELGHYYYDDEYECALHGIVKEFNVF